MWLVSSQRTLALRYQCLLYQALSETTVSDALRIFSVDGISDFFILKVKEN